MLPLFDIGVNLFSTQFDADRSEVVQRAVSHHVRRILLISSDIAEVKLNQSYCDKHTELYCTAGVHPHAAGSVNDDWLQQLSLLIRHNKVLAVGECGLDFNRDFSSRQSQIEVFELQLDLAIRADKPVYLHERDAFDTQLELLKNHKIHNGVAHCFTGSKQQMRAYLDLGLYIGITGWLCDERRHAQLVDALKYLPLDRLVIETDAPYLLPRTLAQKPKSRRNEPMYLPEIASYIAQLTEQSTESIIQTTWRNSCSLFNLPKDFMT